MSSRLCVELEIPTEMQDDRFTLVHAIRGVGDTTGLPAE